VELREANRQVRSLVVAAARMSIRVVAERKRSEDAAQFVLREVITDARAQLDEGFERFALPRRQ
jgi:hypothetical protein